MNLSVDRDRAPEKRHRGDKGMEGTDRLRPIDEDNGPPHLAQKAQSQGAIPQRDLTMDAIVAEKAIHPLDAMLRARTRIEPATETSQAESAAADERVDCD
jgi:hypothetical protein